MIKKLKPTRFEDIFHSYYAGEIIRGVSLAASRLNIDFLIHITNREDHQSWLDASLLNHSFIDGILFADIDNDLSIVKKAIRRKMPCLVLNNIISEPINYVAVDNKKASYEVVSYLIKQGHKRIAIICGDVSTQSGQMRLEGFKQAMQEKDLEVPRSMITFGDYLRTPARVAARKLLKLKRRPTAIFAASDVMALETMDVAKAMKLKIPGDVSIVGFDNNPMGQSISIPLTTVAQPLTEMGRLGVENLYQISRGKASLPLKTVLPTKMILRKSVREN